MSRILAVAVVYLCSSVVASAGSPLDLVEQAVTAQGGAEALRSIKALRITGSARHWEPGESYTAGGEPRATDRSTFTLLWDVDQGNVRTDRDRMIEFPFPTRNRYSEIVTPDYGYVAVAGANTAVVQADIQTTGVHPISGIRGATTLRELARTAPTLLLKALDAPQRLAAVPDQTLGGGQFAGGFGGIFPARRLPAVAYDDGRMRFIILFDPATHLPAAVRTIDDDGLIGDANYDVTFADWRTVRGVQIARAMTYALDNIEIGKVTYDDVAINPVDPC